MRTWSFSGSRLPIIIRIPPLHGYCQIHVDSSDVPSNVTFGHGHEHYLAYNRVKRTYQWELSGSWSFAVINCTTREHGGNFSIMSKLNFISESSLLTQRYIGYTYSSYGDP
jgi:hypothetical protein